MGHVCILQNVSFYFGYVWLPFRKKRLSQGGFLSEQYSCEINVVSDILFQNSMIQLELEINLKNVTYSQIYIYIYIR